MTCENLATKAELAALEQRLTALLSGKIDKAEKPQIIEAGGHQGLKLSEASLGPQIATLITGLGIATAVGQNALGEAKNATSQVYRVKTIAEDAGAAARRAEAEAYLAKIKTNQFEGLLGQLRLKLTNLDMALARFASRFTALEGLVNVLRGSLNGLSGAINGLQSNINRLFGLIRAIDDRFGGLLGKVAALTGKVLNILNAIATITSLVATMASLVQLYRLTQQVNALEQKVSLQGTVIQGILAIINYMQLQFNNVSYMATNAFGNAINALSQSASALSQSSSAISQSQSAINTALNAARQAAIAIAAATAVTAIANAAMNRADRAWDLANRAFNSAKGAGQTIVRQTTNYIDRTITINKVEQRNFIERIEGKPGANGKDGKPGRDGRDGKDMNPADLGEIKRLLYRIDGTTATNLATTSVVLNDTTQVKAKANIIESTLNTLNNFTQKAFRATRMDKVLNALNFILLLHNAAMLSRNLASTLGDLTSQALAVIGIKDENENPIDINSILSKQADGFMSGILGKEVWEGTKESWNKANRIVASASNIIWTIRSIGDSSREIAEWTAENTGKIGNALKRFRIVGDNAYKWMPERVQATDKWTRKVNRVMEGIDKVDDTASSISGALGEVQNIQSEMGELKEQRETFKKQLKELTPKETEDNDPIKGEADVRKQASVNTSEIANVERGQGEPVTSGS